MGYGRRASVATAHSKTMRESTADLSTLDASMQFGPNKAKTRGMIARLFGRSEATIEVSDEATEMEIWLLREKVYSLRRST